MSVLMVALPVAIALGATALFACIWSIRRGQFDDLQSPSVRLLVDEKPVDEHGNDDPPTPNPS
ncbi:cbb3-type cytochrome oxidase assembly protein CcoS [Novipirellula artificiosorum]|uniref:Cytochrome oxidase maturation protein cbb3-type n=1 Tax=Novipirellula artificiosorum TaxID=2528016 RepID=A0A5C6DRE7_9BACT|nr:cbb3-type cytochrome oxidase assembly protein CcoS [Novipirellula artificiosorum]TWU38437.1 Cytochrome oxidase maturation protein cbb3-type [Novipirellula artificiosorum]